MRGVPGCRSRLLDLVSARSEMLTHVMTERHARGVSIRKLEEAFTDATAPWRPSRGAVRDAPAPEAGRQAAADRSFPGAVSAGQAVFCGIFRRRLIWKPAWRICGCPRRTASWCGLPVLLCAAVSPSTTDLIERAFEEQCRRIKVIPRFFAERSCPKLAYAALQRAARRWQRVRITELADQPGSPNWITEPEQRQLEPLRQQLQPDPRPASRLSMKLATWGFSASPLL